MTFAGKFYEDGNVYDYGECRTEYSGQTFVEVVAMAVVVFDNEVPIGTNSFVPIGVAAQRNSSYYSLMRTTRRALGHAAETAKRRIRLHTFPFQDWALIEKLEAVLVQRVTRRG